MSNALKFPRSTYYKALVSEPSNSKKLYENFSSQVLACYLENKKRYGAEKIYQKLNEKGVKCSIKRVQRHMKN